MAFNKGAESSRNRTILWRYWLSEMERQQTIHLGQNNFHNYVQNMHNLYPTVAQLVQDYNSYWWQPDDMLHTIEYGHQDSQWSYLLPVHVRRLANDMDEYMRVWDYEYKNIDLHRSPPRHPAHIVERS